MSNTLPEEEKRQAVTERPLQRISWAAKTKNGREWFKDNVDYFAGSSVFYGTSKNSKDLDVLYDVYNNRFPLEWFNHITNPLNAKVPAHTKYPAKIRPTGMLRTNLDLLLGEYRRRPYVFQVLNQGEDAFNSFLDAKSKAIEANLQEHFLAVAQQAMIDAGQPIEEIPQDQEIELPESVMERFKANYKDNQAIRGQRLLKRFITEFKIRQNHLQGFKDWLITGETYSYKNLEFGNLVYKRVSPKYIDYDKDEETTLIEDGEWVIYRSWHTASSLVDQYYDELKEADHKKLEKPGYLSTPLAMQSHLYTASAANNSREGNKIAKDHVQWRGRKEIIHVTFPDPLTGEMQEDVVMDADTPIDPSMTVTKREWVEEVYEGTRLAGCMYVRLRPVPVQRNQMNNLSACKLSYNGRRYSDTHSENTSVLKMGIPYAIMYMITNFTLEKTIAKNKGKIALIDKNSIPRGDGWDDEKFFYYADALGYMLINRNQQGVDKSWNQYHTLDMSLFDQIKELIGLRDSFKRDWDDVLGINPQRKAQVGARDGLGTTEMAVDLSNTITDIIFALFEEFTESELQGMLDYTKFVNVDGVRGLYNMDDYDEAMLNEDPNTYSMAELGVFCRSSTDEQVALNQYRANTQAMFQNNVKPSTILEIQMANNAAELHAKLKRLEEIEMEQAMSAQQSDHEKEVELEQLKEKFMQLESVLKTQEINAEWDRKDQNEMIKGEYALAGGADLNHNGIPDGAEISKRVIAEQQLLSSEKQKLLDLSQKDKMHKDQMALERDYMDLEREKMESKERIEMRKARAKTAK